MAKADRDSIVHYSLRLNLKNPRHLEIHKILKHLNQEMNKTQNQLFIAALEFYVDNVGKANLVELDKMKSNEYVTRDDIEEIKEELHASVITEARNEVIRLLGGVVAGMQQIVPKGYYPVPQGQERRVDEENHMQDEQTIDQLADLASSWMAEDGGMGE